MPDRNQVATFIAQCRGVDEPGEYELACADSLLAWFDGPQLGVVAWEQMEIEQHENLQRLIETIEWLQTIQHRTQHTGMQELGHNEATCEAKSCVHARSVLEWARTL